MTKADLQKRAGESFLRHSVPGIEFATSVLITSCIFLVHFPILLLKLEDMISYHLSCVSKWEGKLLILLLQYSKTGQLHYIAPAYLSLVRTLCLRIKDLPVKYFHTSCSQKVTKYFLSSLISSTACMNSLAIPYPFLEVHCVLLHLAMQLSKLPVVPWRKEIWANLVPSSKSKFEAYCPQKVQSAHVPEILGLRVIPCILLLDTCTYQRALMVVNWYMDAGFYLRNQVNFHSTLWGFARIGVFRCLDFTTP